MQKQKHTFASCVSSNARFFPYAGRALGRARACARGLVGCDLVTLSDAVGVKFRTGMDIVSEGCTDGE